MECYLVISSRHLSNGHYRGIKGVFRGPLCKKDTRLPDYAEKEKAAAKALEDVKANFYCELCDKQYHKHHEFDNHINSYDHAHKQRLKDLKQREFARNVASKSWKDEKKQEKALKRLHELAELRQHIPGSGPVLKAPRLVLQKQPPPDGFSLSKGAKVPASCPRSPTREGQGLSSRLLEEQQLILSRQQCPAARARALGKGCSPVFPEGSSTSPRAGVSFSFSKKVPLKLESSAAVFSENSEEGSDWSELPSHKTKQGLEGSHPAMILEEESRASLEQGAPIPQAQVGLVDSESSHGAVEAQVLQDNDRSGDGELEEEVTAHPSPPRVKTQLSKVDSSASLQEAEPESKQNEPEQLLGALIPSSSQESSLCPELNHSKQHNSQQAEHPAELPAQPWAKPGLGHRALESSQTLPRETLVQEVKCQALPFLHVLSKDGSTALQWPTELLLFTKTEPCLSYGCNPLYFDFRLSLHPRDSQEQGIKQASCREPSPGGDEGSAVRMLKEDHQLLTPKKRRRGSLKPRKAKQQAESEPGKEMNENGPKCLVWNENLPKVPAYLGLSPKGCVAGDSLQPRALTRPLRGWERQKQSRRSESISFSALLSRITKSQAAKCHSVCPDGKGESFRCIPDVASCSSDISDSGEDLLSDRSSAENEGCGSDRRCWRCPSPHKSSPDRHSSSSATSVSSMSSSLSSMAPTPPKHSKTPWLLGCQRAERHKCTHRKHKSILPSAEMDKDCLVLSTSASTRSCRHRSTVTAPGCSRHQVQAHRDRSQHSRGRHQHFGQIESRTRSYPSSNPCSIRDSSSSQRSLRSRSGSFPKEAESCQDTGKQDLGGGFNTQLGRAGRAQDASWNGNGEGQGLASCSSESLAQAVGGKRKSLTAKGLLERAQSKRSQKHGTESFSKLKDHSPSHFALQFPAPGDGIASFPLPGELLVEQHPATLLETHLEASERADAALSGGTAEHHCLFTDIIPLGPQSLSRTTAIRDQAQLFLNEPSCVPGANHLPGAFPSVVANSAETKDVRLDSQQAADTSTSLHAHALENCADLAICSPFSSPAARQQPGTLSPEEEDNYRWLQLQAQQHMQKQLLAKPLQLLPAAGPAPGLQHPALSSIQHMLLQHLALSSPLSLAQLAPLALSPLAPALIPSHPAWLTAHPWHVLSNTFVPLSFPVLPHAACIPACFSPQLSTASPSALHPNPWLHPFFQGQEPQPHSCSRHSPQLPTA
ncbi:Z804B protein, partial [Bucco capensis]|nr:Z804B protein [Bucco capensis]